MTTAYPTSRPGRSIDRFVSRSVARFVKTSLIASAVVLLGTVRGAWASSATEIAEYITTTTGGDITASVSGSTVTVTDGVDGGIGATPTNSTFLSLTINEGVTVKWTATLKGAPSGDYALVNVLGAGVFQVENGGTIKNTAGGRGIAVDKTSTVNIVGGLVGSTSGHGIENTGKLNVSGGTVSSEENYAIRNDNPNAEINISDSANIISWGNTPTVSNYRGRLNMSGGKVTNTGNKSESYAIGNYSNSTDGFNITGGVVEAVYAHALCPYLASGGTNISGGTILSGANNAVYIHGAKVNISGGTISANGSKSAIYIDTEGGGAV